MEVKIHIYNSKDILLDNLLSSKYLSELEKASFDKYKNLETKKEKKFQRYSKANTLEL